MAFYYVLTTDDHEKKNSQETHTARQGRARTSKKNKKNHRNPNKFDGFIVLLIEQKNYD